MCLAGLEKWDSDLVLVEAWGIPLILEDFLSCPWQLYPGKKLLERKGPGICPLSHRNTKILQWTLPGVSQTAKHRGHSLHPVSSSLLIPTASSEGSKTTFMVYNPLDQTNGTTYSYTLLQGKNTSQNQPRADVHGQSQGKETGVSNIPASLWSQDASPSWHQHVAISRGHCQSGKTMKAHPSSGAPCSSVQLLSRVRLFATPWIAARQASLSITNSQSLLKLMPIKLVMPSSHLILCRPLLLLPPIPPSIRVFSNESTLCMRWPKY